MRGVPGGAGIGLVLPLLPPTGRSCRYWRKPPGGALCPPVAARPPSPETPQPASSSDAEVIDASGHGLRGHASDKGAFRVRCIVVKQFCFDGMAVPCEELRGTLTVTRAKNCTPLSPQGWGITDDIARRMAPSCVGT